MNINIELIRSIVSTFNDFDIYDYKLYNSAVSLLEFHKDYYVDFSVMNNFGIYKSNDPTKCIAYILKRTNSGNRQFRIYGLDGKLLHELVNSKWHYREGHKWVLMPVEQDEFFNHSLEYNTVFTLPEFFEINELVKNLNCDIEVYLKDVIHDWQS